MAWLALLFHMALFIAKASSEGRKLVKPGCQEKCGAVDIPYPFGIGPNCFLHKGFEITCKMIGGSMVPFHGNMEVLSIMLTKAHTKVYNNMSWQCYQKSTAGTSFNNQPLNLVGTVYRLSKHHNRFVVIGCEALAFNEMQDYKNNHYRTGCVSTCHSQKKLKKDTCSGNGCCQTPIPYGIKYYNISFPLAFNSDFWNYSHCNYAVVMEKDNYAPAIDLWSRSGHNGTVPVVLNWFIGNETCEVAQANKSNYACVSSNSLCTNSHNDTGYTCNCSHGYDGNPYLLNGCQGQILSLK
jgi:Wall-associated receptor kinase galacturonan-binding